MSTRSVIARKTPQGFTGVYPHWDGYPSGVGVILFQLYNGYFKKDIKKMMRTLIDEHPAGWSNINGADFSMEPGFTERDFTLPEDAPEKNRPQCYCHGDRHESAQVIEKQGDTGGTEYAYAIDEEEQMMWCYRWLYKSQEWHFFAFINLNSEEDYDWESLS